MAREIKKDQHFRDRLLKLIPSEIVATYLVIVGFIPKVENYPNRKIVLTIVSIGLLVLVPFYLRKFQNVKRLPQIVFTMVAFLVWIYSLGGPFESYNIYDPIIGSIILIFWSLLIPFFYNPEA